MNVLGLEEPRAMSLSMIFISLLYLSASGQKSPEEVIRQHAGSISGNVGVHAILLETGETVSYQADQRFPMQSVYKFPIAMAVLNQVDQGKLHLDQVISGITVRLHS